MIRRELDLNLNFIEGLLNLPDTEAGAITPETSIQAEVEIDEAIIQPIQISDNMVAALYNLMHNNHTDTDSKLEAFYKLILALANLEPDEQIIYHVEPEYCDIEESVQSNLHLFPPNVTLFFPTRDNSTIQPCPLEIERRYQRGLVD